jgi:hypothetical protein
MADIYEQHKAAFAGVAAYVITDQDGSRIATVAIRYPSRGMRLWAYVHLIGVEMVRAHADGGGYDKASAAVANAISKIKAAEPGERDGGFAETLNAHRAAFLAAIPKMDSGSWDNALRDAGYNVLCAVY